MRATLTGTARVQWEVPRGCGSTMDQWSILEEELERWAERRAVATLWWRDDDAESLSPALARLLAISDAAQVGVVVAAIPAGCDASLAAAVMASGHAVAVQHGFRHLNHEPAGSKASEFGPARSLPEVRRELAHGWQRLRSLFTRRLLPVFVPPWNRVAGQVVAALPALGFDALSTYRPRREPFAATGLRQVNCHADVMDWRGTRGFIGLDKVLADLAGHLGDRREGRVDAGEPTGLLTHHLAHDEHCWLFLEALFGRLRSHPAVRWLQPAEALCPH